MHRQHPKPPRHQRYSLHQFQRAKNLERVALRGTPVTDKATNTLKRLPRLWEANVGSTKITAKGQRRLAEVLSRKRAAVEYDVSRAVDPATTLPQLPGNMGFR